MTGVNTWRFSDVTDPTTGQKRLISGQLPQQSELHFSQDIPRLKLTWGLDTLFSTQQRFYRFNEIDTYRVGTYDTLYIESRPRPDLALRFSIMNVGRRPFDATRQVFSGPMNIDPLAFVDHQDRNFGLEYYFRARKTFG